MTDASCIRGCPSVPEVLEELLTLSSDLDIVVFASLFYGIEGDASASDIAYAREKWERFQADGIIAVFATLDLDNRRRVTDKISEYIRLGRLFA